MSASRVLFFLFWFAAPALASNVILPLGGSGDFFCGFYPSTTGYAAQVDASFSGQDSQGNSITANVVNAFTKNAPQCSLSVPQIGPVPGPGGTAFGFEGSVDYLGIAYTTNFAQDCAEYTASTQQFIGYCTAVFDVGQNGYITLTITPCASLTLECEEYGGFPFLLEGWAQITSLSFGQEPTQYGTETFETYYSDGTFDILPAPEPAAYALMICGVFLLMGRKFARRCQFWA